MTLVVFEMETRQSRRQGLEKCCFVSFYFVCVVLRIEPQVMGMLGKAPSMELHSGTDFALSILPCVLRLDYSV